MDKEIPGNSQIQLAYSVVLYPYLTFY